MGLRDFLNTIDQRYAWSPLSVILTLMFGGLAIYLGFFRDLKPELRFEIVSNTSVLDVREDLGKLEILYDGLDIKKSNQSLRVVVVRVINSGETGILMSHYDEREPLGFTFSTGKLLRVELLEASSRYLMSNLRASLADSLLGVFEPVILESKDYFMFKALILHAQGWTPILSPYGKIAGIRAINVTELSSTESEKSYWHLVFAGGVWVQAARLISYFFGFIGLSLGLILLLFAVIFPIVFVSEKFTRKKRKKHVKLFRRVTNIELQDKDEFLFSAYEDNGPHYIHAMVQLLSDKTKLKEAIDELPEQGDESESLYRSVGVGTTDIPPSVMREREFGIRALLQNNVIQQKDDSWEEDTHVVQTILAFDEFLVIREGA